MMLADFTFPRPLRRVAENLARVVCPPDLDEAGLLDPVIEHLQLAFRSLPRHVRVALVAGLTGFELSSLPFHGRRFSRLDRDAARAHFERVWRGPVGPARAFLLAIKALTVFGYYEQPAVRARIAYHPDQWIAEAARRRLETYGVDIAEHEKLVTAPDPLIPASTLVSHAKAG